MSTPAANEPSGIEDRESLICVEDPELLKLAVNAVEGLRFSSPFSVEDAVHRVKSHHYAVILLSETFRCENRHQNRVLEEISYLPLDQRRTQFVVLIGKYFETGDPLTAFAAGVDAVVNVSDIEKVGRMVWQGRAEKKAFYRRYLDALENLVIT